MPRPFSKFHQLSNRSKRRRVAENNDCSYMSDDHSSSDFNDSSNGFFSNNDNTNQQLNTSNEQDVRNSLNDRQTLSNCTNQNINNDEYEQILSSTSSSEYNIIDEDVLLDFDSDNLFPRQLSVNHPENYENSIKNFLRCWAVKHNITGSAVSELLVGLKKSMGSISHVLPSDSRTLLKTSFSF